MPNEAWSIAKERREGEELVAACAGVVKVYYAPVGEVSALRGIDAEFPARGVTAVVGPSGSGKSSLLRILAGFDRPTAGSVRIGGVETNELRLSELRTLRRRLVGYVFQRPADNLTSYLSVREHLRQAAHLRGRAAGWREEAEEILAILGLGARADHLPRQLSGGEQQRAAFAAAVMGRPALVVADEPTGELDTMSARSLLGSVTSLASRGTGFAIATHDAEVVQAAARTYHLRHGSVEAEATADRKLSVIDAAGRIQLPSGWQRLFPDGRAEIEERENEMRIKPP